MLSNVCKSIGSVANKGIKSHDHKVEEAEQHNVLGSISPVGIGTGKQSAYVLIYVFGSMLWSYQSDWSATLSQIIRSSSNDLFLVVDGLIISKMNNQTKRQIAGHVVVMLLIALSTWLKLSSKEFLVHSPDASLSNMRKSQQMVDIISIGSVSKKKLQDAQGHTFESHSSVRNFFRLTERNDTDQECSKTLTPEQVSQVAWFCKGSKGVSGLKFRLLNELYFEKKAAGWVCAQKRPIDALYRVLANYKDGKMIIPHYLFMIDDDTYVNMDYINDFLYNDFPYDTPYVVTGCVFYGAKNYRMNFLYGGFGSYFSRAAIQRLLKPINCNSNNGDVEYLDSYTRFACWRLQQNMFGEKAFFTDGMSVNDLMYKYASDQPFTQVQSWEVGYCFHSDHALTYFLNMYHIAVPDHELDAHTNVTDGLRRIYQYSAVSNATQGRHWCKGECIYEHDKCFSNSTLCHYVEPYQMYALFDARPPKKRPV
jgi:hypothetical protein